MDLTLLSVSAMSLVSGFVVSFLYFAFKKNIDELSYNVTIIKEDLVNIQVKLESLSSE